MTDYNKIAYFKTIVGLLSPYFAYGVNKWVSAAIIERHEKLDVFHYTKVIEMNS